jgi:hypothetical protein
MKSKVALLHGRCLLALTVCSVKKKLRSGEDVVTGDRWPLFIYADCKYDPEDPWNGLLRGDILVNVRCLLTTSRSDF